MAFCFCVRLVSVDLNEELEEIGNAAFSSCTVLCEIRIPPLVREIKQNTFYDCSGLTTVTLGDGLEEIGKSSFYRCYSLAQIVIPNAVKKIKSHAFQECSGLTAVTLGEGLEEIGEWAFSYTALKSIRIPPAVKAIHGSAFYACSNLESVVFTQVIEEFVSCEALQVWWNRGVHEMSLCTYCFLVRCSIPERFVDLALVSSWQVNIHEMLRGIPTIDTRALDAYFDSIDFKVSAYENLLSAAPTLFPEQFGVNYYSVLNILSFL